MALRATPTIAICLTAGIAAGIALARPGDQPDPAAATPAPAVDPASDVPADAPDADNDSPYLVDGTEPAVGGSDVAPPVSDPIGISIVDFDFTPAGEISPGSPIAVTNLDSADHTLTATDGSFDTRALGLNEVASIAAPAVAGTYEFFCEIHPSMTGQLVVS